MHHVAKSIAGVMLAFSFLVPALAATCKEYQVSLSGVPNVWFPSKASACSAVNGKKQTPTRVYTQAALNGAGNCSSKIIETFTDGTTATYGPSISGVSERNGVCPPDCPAAGTSKILNFTTGYTRSPAADPVQYDTPYSKPPVDACSETCGYTKDSTVEAYVSREPAPNGMYRASRDVKYNSTGARCEASPENSPASGKPETPPPPCAGDVGTVNGRAVCVAKPNQPFPPSQPEPPPVDGAKPTAGNPSAGPAPAASAPDGSDSNGSGSGGYGRTPAQGDGGNAGGPRCAASADPKACDREGDGTTDEPTEGKEQAACGAPGQPKCRIDETGTPNGKGVFDQASQAGKALGDAQKTQLGEGVLSGIDAPSWSWSFQLPAGCTAYTVGGLDVVLNVCQWQPMIHDLMSMIWLSTAVWCCISMVGKTIRGE